jgi:protein-S-isoprenylcysteine O-methyltransferase Ste14
MDTIKRQAVPGWAMAMNAFNTFLSQDLLGGPKQVKIAWVINLHKFLTVFVVGLFMILFNNYSAAAWVYLALHGTYGFCWLLKHVAFRDAKWETRITFGGAAFLFLLLATYWIAPFLLISNVLGADRLAPPLWLIAFCIILFTLGLTIMTASDCQKNITLKHRQGLITDGMFKHVRHPNYLGEMMLYASFALLVQHWIPWLVLAYWWITVFLVNMLVIESSLSRYPEWEAYKSRTGRLLPWRLL